MEKIIGSPSEKLVGMGKDRRRSDELNDDVGYLFDGDA
jgi:hypothetical protein